MDPGHESELPKGLVARLRSIEKKLEQALDGWRQLAARLRGPSDVTTPTPFTPLAAGELPAGVPATEFKTTPFFEVGRGTLRDGRGGPIKASKVLRGAERKILAHLLSHRSINAVDVIAYQMEDDGGTILNRLNHARTTMWKIKKAIRGVATVTKEGGRRGWTWSLTLNPTIQIEFSVDDAFRLAEQAHRELEAGRPIEAHAMALQAIVADDCVQFGHLVACRAALAINSATQPDIARLRKSMRSLERHITQLRRVCTVIARSCSYIHKDELRIELKGFEAKFTDELQSFHSILEQMIAKFGDPHGNDRPEDLAVNSLIEQFRAERLTHDQARFDPRGRIILSHKRVFILREEIRELALNKNLDDVETVGQTVNDIVLDKVLDVRLAPSIRLVCDHAYWEIEKSCCESPWNCPEGRDATMLNKTKGAFRAKHERDPAAEEMARSLGWTLERVKSTEDWERFNKPERLDSDGSREWKKDPEDDSEDNDLGGMFAITGE